MKVAAVSSMMECWRRLEKVYGDRTLNIVTVKNNLRLQQLKGSQRWEKVIDLYEQVEKATTQLEVLDAQESLNHEFELVSELVGKLAYDYQEEWDRYCITNTDSAAPVWQKFWAWLTDANHRASASKLRNMAARVSKPDLASNPTCPKCKENTGRVSDAETKAQISRPRQLCPCILH